MKSFFFSLLLNLIIFSAQSKPVLLSHIIDLYQERQTPSFLTHPLSPLLQELKKEKAALLPQAIETVRLKALLDHLTNLITGLEQEGRPLLTQALLRPSAPCWIAFAPNETKAEGKPPIWETKKIFETTKSLNERLPCWQDWLENTPSPSEKNVSQIEILLDTLHTANRFSKNHLKNLSKKP